jgi:hypothetical protein
MTKRDKITAKINAKQNQIDLLRKDIIKLKREALLLSDKVQWFTEEMEIDAWANDGSKRLCGRIYWNNKFKDEDTGKFVTVKRSMVVRINGEWV